MISRLADDSSGKLDVAFSETSFRFSRVEPSTSFCATITLALGTHPVRGKGRSPPIYNLFFRTFFQPNVRTMGTQ